MNLLLFSVLAFGLILALAHNNKSGDINAYLMFSRGPNGINIRAAYE